MSVNYPEKPTDAQKQTVSVFMDSLSKTYPCDYCARDLRRNLKEEPPKLGSRSEFALWMCQLHNKVFIFPVLNFLSFLSYQRSHVVRALLNN
ncbi:Erv1 / Alr family protein [Cooperia oncophora]